MDRDAISKWSKVIENIAPLPFIVGMLLQKLEDPDVSVKDIENILSRDPLLVAKVLKMANSAYYGFPRSIATVREAVIILGINTVRSICLAVSIKSVMDVDASGYWFGNFKGLWEHSLLVGSGARIVAKKLKLNDPEKFFVAGLLHDIGKVILSSVVKEYKLQILKNLIFGNKSISQSEEDFVGISHNIVGYLLANYWNLPQFISDIILYHDDPLNAPREIIENVLVVSSANELSYNFVSEDLKQIGLSERRDSKGSEYLGSLGLLKEKDSILESMRKILETELEV